VTGIDFQLARLLVDASLAAGLPLEVLDCIGDVSRLAVDRRIRQRTIEEPAGRADKRFAGEVFLIAGLLADEHDVRRLTSGTEHGLRGVLPQRTVATVGRLLAHGGDRPIEAWLAGGAHARATGALFAEFRLPAAHLLRFGFRSPSPIS
jgi:hypothetical protein